MLRFFLKTKKMSAPPMRPSAARPPTTPPTMAPTFVFFSSGSGVFERVGAGPDVLAVSDEPVEPVVRAEVPVVVAGALAAVWKTLMVVRITLQPMYV